MVRSDNDRRSSLGRPRLSRLSAMSSVSDTETLSNVDSCSTPASSAAPISVIPFRPGKFSLFLTPPEYFDRGFLNTWSSVGLRNLVTSRPGSACSFSRDGEGRMDLDGVLVGNGSLDTRRGIPVGR